MCRAGWSQAGVAAYVTGSDAACTSTEDKGWQGQRGSRETFEFSMKTPAGPTVQPGRRQTGVARTGSRSLRQQVEFSHRPSNDDAVRGIFSAKMKNTRCPNYPMALFIQVLYRKY